MEEITDDLPLGSFVVIDGDDGSTVTYIDLNLELRVFTIGKTRRWVPNFLVPNVDDGMLPFLKRRLREESPGAQTMRHLKSDDGFFLYTIRESV